MQQVKFWIQTRAGQEAVFHRGDRLVVVVDALGQALAQVLDVARDDAKAFVQVAAQCDDVVGLLVDGRTRPGARARAGTWFRLADDS